MKKSVILLIFLLMLSGCQKTTLDYGFVEGLSKPVPKSTNHTKDYLSYYLPPHVGLKESGANYSLLDVEGYDVLMRLSIEHIISEKFDYEKNLAKEISQEILFQDDASYIDIEDNSKTVHAIIYQLEDRYAILINNEEIEMMSLVPKTNVSITLESMVNILKTVVVNKDLVVSDYSSKEISTYESTYSEFFEQTPPETGTLKEMNEQLDPGKSGKE
ncbi:MAG TPA: hypothetical protein VFC75_01450 [Erysipelothrix sp.]|nr:hypothetical protein [Erysipelothrix sp.]